MQPIRISPPKSPGVESSHQTSIQSIQSGPSLGHPPSRNVLTRFKIKQFQKRRRTQSFFSTTQTITQKNKGEQHPPLSNFAQRMQTCIDELKVKRTLTSSDELLEPVHLEPFGTTPFPLPLPLAQHYHYETILSA